MNTEASDVNRITPRDGRTLAPPAMGRALAEALPHGHITWCEGEGHGLWFKHWPEMLDVLLRSTDASPDADTHWEE